MSDEQLGHGRISRSKVGNSPTNPLGGSGYLMFPISYRDLELMLRDRGIEVDYTTIFRWIQAYAAEFEQRIRPWRVDETEVVPESWSPLMTIHR